MKHRAALVSAFLLFAALAPQLAFAQTPPGMKPGFRDLKWGDPLPKDMVKGSERFHKIDFYSRPSDSMVIGGMPINALTYGFYRERLAMVELELDAKFRPELSEFLAKQWGSWLDLVGLRIWRSATGSENETHATLHSVETKGGKEVVRLSIRNERLASKAAEDEKKNPETTAPSKDL